METDIIEVAVTLLFVMLGIMAKLFMQKMMAKQDRIKSIKISLIFGFIILIPIFAIIDFGYFLLGIFAFGVVFLRDLNYLSKHLGGE